MLQKSDICVPIHAHEASQERPCANVAGMVDDEEWENMAPRLDDTPRRLAPRSAVAYCEREPGRLQLRLVVDVDEHIDDIVVDESDDSVVVFASVCSPTTGACRDQIDAPFHVYLDEPLGERRVIDALSGRELPYRHVLAELAAEQARRNGGDPDPGEVMD
jgi:hypothetical protein